MFAQQSLGTEAFTVVGTTQLHQLGEIRWNGAGSKSYRYVRAGAAITAGDAVKGTSDATPYSAVVKTASASGANQMILGVAMATLANLEYGWVQRTGISETNVAIESATVAPGDPLQASASNAGRFNIATAAALCNASAWCLVDATGNVGTVLLDCP